VCPEQGIGDELLFTRFLPLLAELGAECVTFCDARLVDLLRASGLPGRFLPYTAEGAAEVSDADFQIGAGSLASKFIHTTDDLKRLSKRPFLFPDRENAKTLRAKYLNLRQTNRVIGISWRGGGNEAMRRKRTIDIEAFLPLFQHADTQFISLQYGDTKADLKKVSELNTPGLYEDPDIDPIADIEGFIDQIEACDLVISIDNSTVHLAGAIGKETWALLPLNCDWRWGTEAHRNFWYDSVTLFRQTRALDWEMVIRMVKAALYSL
ncbi:MAG: hypothetical protein AAF226_18600, partial [Verrucomicrobiota bacterium]